MWPCGQCTRLPCAVERDALRGRGSRLSPGVSAYQRIISNKVDMLHVRLTELHAAHQTCLVTCLPTNNYGVLYFPLF